MQGWGPIRRRRGNCGCGGDGVGDGSGEGTIALCTVFNELTGRCRWLDDALDCRGAKAKGCALLNDTGPRSPDPPAAYLG